MITEQKYKEDWLNFKKELLAAYKKLQPLCITPDIMYPISSQACKNINTQIELAVDAIEQVQSPSLKKNFNQELNVLLIELEKIQKEQAFIQVQKWSVWNGYYMVQEAKKSPIYKDLLQIYNKYILSAPEMSAYEKPILGQLALDEEKKLEDQKKKNIELQLETLKLENEKLKKESENGFNDLLLQTPKRKQQQPPSLMSVIQTPKRFGSQMLFQQNPTALTSFEKLEIWLTTHSKEEVLDLKKGKQDGTVKDAPEFLDKLKIIFDDQLLRIITGKTKELQTTTILPAMKYEAAADSARAMAKYCQGGEKDIFEKAPDMAAYYLRKEVNYRLAPYLTFERLMSVQELLENYGKKDKDIGKIDKKTLLEGMKTVLDAQLDEIVAGQVGSLTKEKLTKGTPEEQAKDVAMKFSSLFNIYPSDATTANYFANKEIVKKVSNII